MKVREIIRIIEAALKLHLEVLKKDGAEITKPSTKVEYIEISI